MTFDHWWDTTGASLMGMQPNDVMRAAYDVARAAWEAAQADAAQRDQLLAFAKEVMQAWPEGGIDGGELQDIALAHGLLRPAAPPTDWDGCNFYERTELIK